MLLSILTKKGEVDIVSEDIMRTIKISNKIDYATPLMSCLERNETLFAICLGTL